MHDIGKLFSGRLERVRLVEITIKAMPKILVVDSENIIRKYFRE